MYKRQGKYSDKLSAEACTACLNSSYCGQATVVPLHGIDVLQMQTSYTHGWELVEVPEFEYNFTWWDPQYFRQDEVLTENSVQALWFGVCIATALSICIFLTWLARGNPWLRNYIRGERPLLYCPL